jgi:hypothetical protein
MTDTALGSLVMYGAREVLAWTGDSAHIERQIRYIEQEFSRDPGLVFDASKALIEGVCKTILDDRGHKVVGKPELPNLLKMTLASVPLVSTAVASSAGDSIKKTIQGLQTVIHGMCELRREHGSISHGKEADTPEMTSIHALLVARAADAIVHFLLMAHRAFPSSAVSKYLRYEDRPDLNDYIDSSNEAVRIFDLAYNPSEVLYAVDMDAYRDALANFQTDSDHAEEESNEYAEEVTV